MPRPTTRPLPELEGVYEELAQWDVRNAPRPSGEVSDRKLVSLLAFALFYACRMKVVTFPEAVDWERPSFEVSDDRLTARVVWTSLDGLADLQGVLDEAGTREAEANVPVIAALDAMDAEASEFQIEHALYGEVVLLAFRVRPPKKRDPRIEAARERGWVGTLKEHNLLPGRSLFIPDDNLGFFLTSEATRHLAGVHVLLPNGHFTLELNPFVKDDVNDPDLQYWLQWGRGGAASEWHDVLAVDDPESDQEP